MDVPSLLRFSKTTLVLWAVALVVAGLISPPDPFTLLVYAAPLVLPAPGLAYVLVYRGGFDYLRKRTSQ